MGDAGQMQSNEKELEMKEGACCTPKNSALHQLQLCNIYSNAFFLLEERAAFSFFFFFLHTLHQVRSRLEPTCFEEPAQLHVPNTQGPTNQPVLLHCNATDLLNNIHHLKSETN